MDLSYLVGSKVKIKGDSYTYRGKVIKVNNDGILIEEDRRYFVPWGEISSRKTRLWRMIFMLRYLGG